MTDATADRVTPRRSGEQVTDTLAPGVCIPAGAMYGLTKEGLAAPVPIAGVNDPVRAVALRRADAAAGDTVVHGAPCGVWLFENDDAEPVTLARIGKNAGVVDGHTVKSSGMPSAGRIFDVTADGVWIEIGVIKP